MDYERFYKLDNYEATLTFTSETSLTFCLHLHVTVVENTVKSRNNFYYACRNITNYSKLQV